ncbi:MAG: hypothetical protein NWF13_02770 [Candidatus Bathyarchaeota archaeon]|jgi:hypothetical protein|nr:hypothetical protein [Candidatus Bathyarchaeota archaeon]
MSGVKSFFKNLSDKIGWNVPEIDITPKRSEEIIEKIVNYAKQWDMEDMFILGTTWFRPMSAIVGYTVILPWAPLLDMVGVSNPYEYVAFLSDHRNMQALMERLSEKKST